MKIKIFGTAAAEGIPALFCHCRVCTHAQNSGGKEIRSRSQTLINHDLLIDFPGDTFLHKLRGGLPLSDIEHLLITHSHHDHFLPEDLMMRMHGYGAELEGVLKVYGNETVQQMYQRAQDLEGFRDDERIQFQAIKPYETLNVLDYEIVPLMADHGNNEACYLYQIRQAGKTILYGHDSGYFVDSLWDYWRTNPPFFSLVILDCTHQVVPVSGNHMSFADNLKIKEKMINLGYASLSTVFMLSHFSHNGGLNHQEIVSWANEHGFVTAYDGIVIEV